MAPRQSGGMMLGKVQWIGPGGSRAFVAIPVLSAVFLTCFCAAAPAQTRTQTPDAQLLAEINETRAIDNHAHPPRVLSVGEHDDEYDALPCEPLEPTQPNLMGRRENPLILQALKALYAYPYNDRSPQHVAELLRSKARVKQEQGDHYANWVLDRLGIETEFANRVALGRGLAPPRFRWVPFDDALIFPLDNSALAAETPDRAIFFPRESFLLRRYLTTLKIPALPKTLAEYETGVVTPTLEAQKRAGAIGVKFEAAYLRALDFAAVSPQEAAGVYARYATGGVPSRADYKILQDFLFHYVAAEAGRLGMPVHLHTGAGCGGYFALGGANPLLLEPALNDPTLRKTNFVLIHGGAGAFSKEMAVLLTKPNVYTDFSEQTWLLSVRQLSRVVRYWLEWYPEKVLFGTDLSPGSGDVDWEEIGYVTEQTGRQALATALSEMVQDREITQGQAREMARMVLRDNARKLYPSLAK